MPFIRAALQLRELTLSDLGHVFCNALSRYEILLLKTTLCGIIIFSMLSRILLNFQAIKALYERYKFDVVLLETPVDCSFGRICDTYGFISNWDVLYLIPFMVICLVYLMHSPCSDLYTDSN
jgi:hypothetical protein